MPKLIQGGNYVYGWIVVGADGSIPLPDELRTEYGIEGEQDMILIQGSEALGGFGVCRHDKLKASGMGVILERYRELETTPSGEPVMVKGKSKIYGRAPLGGDYRLKLLPEIRKTFGVSPGDRLLAIRGSGVVLSFASAGPILKEARRYEDLAVWE
ncbi:MAG: hypothetical protein RAO92_05045 [Candidatus Euphemobacter frigidus]|nr:hypothetical protein [Candidatus Euphemobacter frigidus]MDP8275750.1 hypothetical protein [Candidatus Euphemobacter frigidus]